MRVILMHDELYEYLGFVLGKYVRGGLDPEELNTAAALWSTVQEAKTIDFSKLGKAEIEKIGPAGISLNLTPEEPLPSELQPTPECQQCFDEEGSMACIRPAHKTRRVTGEAPGC